MKKLAALLAFMILFISFPAALAAKNSSPEPTSEPIPEPTWWENLLAHPWLLAGIGGGSILLAIFLILLLRRRRRNDQEA